MQPAAPSACERPSGPCASTLTALLRIEATSTKRLSGLTVTSSGDARARAAAQSEPPRWVTHPAVPAGWVRLPSAARLNTATPLGKRRPVTYTWAPSGLTATLVGSFSARPTTQPPPGRWLTHPRAPAS